MAECDHNCEGCSANCGERTAPPKFWLNGNVRNVIGVVSGKGGVGKSLVTGLMASGMAKQGFRTAILDADITGPSIPRMFGLHEHVLSDGHFIQPAVSRNGTKIVSMNLCLPDEGDPVVWRGPVLSGVLEQFCGEVDWGNVDFMFVDMPPGTGDVPLTVFQSLPLKGIVIVTTPQELVSMIVHKAVRMAEIMSIPVLGIVENMAYYECPDCGKRHYLFGKNRSGYTITSELPIVPELAELCDTGRVEDFEAGRYLDGIISVLTSFISLSSEQ